jgi:hypothetical protein
MRVEIKFTWRRELNRTDYEVIEAPSLLAGQSLLDVVDVGTKIVARDGLRDQYQPPPDLWERFSRIRNKSEAIDFVRLYGPLTRDGLRGKAEIVELIVLQAEDMRTDTVGAFPLSKLTARLIRDRLQVEPNSLLDALWLQYADAKSRGDTERCQQCNEQFQTGRGHRRSRSKFCSDKCRITFHSLARSQR